MRRFELVDGKSNKFWEITVEGSELHLRWGKIGTAGQAKTKKLEEPAKAEKESAKQIASKLKKGYSEVEAGPEKPKPVAAPPALKVEAVSTAEPQQATPSKSPKTEAPPPLPDESQPVMTDGWRRIILPRRGGSSNKIKLTTTKTAMQYGLEAVEKNESGYKEAPWASAKRGFSGEDVPDLDLGRALAYARNGRKARTALTDYWVQSYGIAETIELVLGTHAAVERSSGYPDHNWDHDFYFRLRTILATVGDEEFEQAQQWTQERRKTLNEWGLVVTACLFPSETHWAWEVLEVAHTRAYALLAVTVEDPEAADRLIRKGGHWAFLRLSRNPFPSLIDGLGLAADRVVGDFVNARYIDIDLTKSVGTALACLPTEHALEQLLVLCDKNKHGLAGLQTSLTNFPCLGLRVLSRRDDQERWLKFVLKAHPGALAAVSSELTADQRAYLQGLDTGVDEDSLASPEECPSCLLSPAWENRKKVKALKLVLDTLPCPSSIHWREGERERWRSPQTKDLPDLSLEDYYATIPPWQAKARNAPTNLVRAPLSAARELLPTWQPDDPWYVNSHMPGIVSRFELETLPAMKIFAAKSLKDAVPFFGPLADCELSVLAAEAFARLKSVRRGAFNYLARHPRTTAVALIPRALGKAKKERNQAENALSALARQGHSEVILETAQAYGPDAFQGIEQLLGRDPLDLLPSKMPALPDWFDPDWVPRPKLKTGGLLPDQALRNFALMLAISKAEGHYAGVALVSEACTPQSMAEFAWGLTGLWLEVGAPSKENWAFRALGWLGDDESARRLTPLLKKWPGEGGHARAVLGLQVLTDIGTDVALMHLYGLSQKLKFKGLKKNAGEKIAEIAEQRGLSAAQLGDRLVPDLGLDQDGSMLLDYGERQFRVGFDEQLKPYVLDGNGKQLKNLPKPGKKDHEELAPAAFARFKALKKDVKTVAKQQLLRLETAMCLQRRWSAEEFQTFFIDHPLVIHLVRRLTWAVFESDEIGDTFRVAEDRSMANCEDDEWSLPPSATVGLPHRLEVPEAIQAAWGELFADYEVLQPFEQFGRSLYPPTAADKASKALTMLKGQEIEAVRVLSLESRGWRRGEAMDGGVICWMLKELPGGKVAYLNLDPGIVVGDPTAFGDLQFREVTLGDDIATWDASPKFAFGDLSDVGFSELVRDLESLRS